MFEQTRQYLAEDVATRITEESQLKLHRILNALGCHVLDLGLTDGLQAGSPIYVCHVHPSSIGDHNQGRTKSHIIRTFCMLN